MQPIYEGLRNAVVFEKLKHAAIYFDRVAPVCFRQARGGDPIVVEVPEEVPAEALVDVVYGAGSASPVSWPHLFFDYLRRWGDFMGAIRSIRMSDAKWSCEDDYADLPRLYKANRALEGGRTIRDAFQAFSQSLGATFSTVVAFGSDAGTNSTDEPTYYGLTLLKLPLIDADAASWEQVIDLRRDADAAKKLRRLRLFFYENYAGKPAPFIEDDLMHRLDDYDVARRKHGFEAVTGSISSILKGPNLTSAVGTGVAAALFGGPVVGLGAAMVVEVGNLAIELAKKVYAVREYEKGHEFAYLIEAGKKLRRKRDGKGVRTIFDKSL